MNEQLDKIKKGLKKLDYELDKSLSSTIRQAEISKVTAREYKDRIVEGSIRARIIGEKTKKTLDEKGDEVTMRLSEVDLSDISAGIIDNVVTHPEIRVFLHVSACICIGLNPRQTENSVVIFELDIFRGLLTPIDKVFDDTDCG